VIGNTADCLAEYFANSRLHFIGSHRRGHGGSGGVASAASGWGGAAAAAATQAGAAAPAAAAPATATTTSYILHVDLDSFFASVALRDNPQYVLPLPPRRSAPPPHPRRRYKDCPVAISGGSGSSGEIATCNYKAREFGIRKGSHLEAARRLCPDLVVLKYDFDAYEKVSEVLEAALAGNGAQYEQVRGERSERKQRTGSMMTYINRRLFTIMRVAGSATSAMRKPQSSKRVRNDAACAPPPPPSPTPPPPPSPP
jgi:DNA repair protein REV1